MKSRAIGTHALAMGVQARVLYAEVHQPSTALHSSSPSSLASVLGPLGSLASSLQRSLGVWAFVILLVSWLLVLLLAPSGWLTAVVSVAMVPRQISTNRYREREYTTSRETEPVQPRRGPARSC